MWVNDLLGTIVARRTAGLVPSSAGGTDEGRDGGPILRRTDLIPLLAYMAFAAVLGWRQGQDANWDLRNYHSYNVFMWFSDRFERDIHVAGVQTFLNPLLDVPLYFAAIRFDLSPIYFGLTLSALHGVLLFLVHRITTLALAGHGPLVTGAGGVTAAITSAYGAAVYAEVGTSLGDNVVALPVLGALALVIANAQAGQVALLRASRRAGLFVGLAAGAKLVGGVYAFGLLAATLIIAGTTRARIERALHFGTLALVGLLVTSGSWMWLMYEHFGSPVFPFLNGIFASPLAPAENFSDAYGPTTWQGTLAFPFNFAGEQMVAAETFFRDGRLAAAFVSLAAAGIIGGKRALTGSVSAASVSAVRLCQLAAFFAVSYGVWLKVFALYRYALPLEALSAAIIVASGAYLVRDKAEGLLLALPICALLILSTKPPEYERIPWADSFFGVSRDDLSGYRDAVVLMTDFPSAYAVPFFPQSATFLRISSNWGLEPGSTMWQRVHERVAAAPADRLYWLELAPYATPDEADTLLTPFGLVLQPSACSETTTNFDAMRVCRLTSR